MALTHKQDFNPKNRRNIFLSALFLIFIVTACKISYSFSGASISPQVKTLSVQSFLNRAALVQPGLDQILTDALIDKCRAQTGLEMVSSFGDVDFEGEITDYKTEPVTVAADAYAATNRFTITVRVRFTNTIDTDLSFDQSFTRYEDYNSDLNISEVEQTLVPNIIKMIVEDIFNKAFVNW